MPSLIGIIGELHSVTISNPNPNPDPDPNPLPE
jgi:hypothetical protein